MKTKTTPATLLIPIGPLGSSGPNKTTAFPLEPLKDIKGQAVRYGSHFCFFKSAYIEKHHTEHMCELIH